MILSRALAATVALVLATEAQAQTNTWSPTGGMTSARSSHTATLLPNGTVLVVGGERTNIGTADVYDASSGNWTATVGLGEFRSGHTATLLADGRVLVAGGLTTTTVVASAQLYDPATGHWSPTGSLSTPRYGHTATLLPNGRVLVTGGDSTASHPPRNDPGLLEEFLNSAEVYDPATGLWSPTPNMVTRRISHTATLLLNGKVLVAGGWEAYYFLGGSNTAFIPVNSAELFDPVSGTWSPTGLLKRERSLHTATLLTDGRVLVVHEANDSSEIYDPSNGTWALTANIASRRRGHTAARLPDGRVLVAGGHSPGFFPNTYFASAELYDPSNGTWSPTGSLAGSRAYHTLTLLQDGAMLAAGGLSRANLSSPIVFRATAELYDFELVPIPSLTIGDVILLEGHAGTTNAVFTVTLSAGSAQPITVGFSTSDVSATAGSDYVSGAGTLTFDPGETSQTISIAVNGDTDVEPPESFVLNLAGASNATIADAQASGTIVNDDVAPLPELSIGDVIVAESDADGRMTRTRSSHTATQLLDGRVLVASHGVGEVYDPSTGAWSVAGIMVTPRYVHTATLLTDGRVLVAGGWNDITAFAGAEVYDPPSNSWSATGSMGQARWDHTSTRLPDGRVLVTGGTVLVGVGMSAVKVYLSSAELYNPVTGTWSPAASMAAPRANHVATLLANGKVLVIGGRHDNTALASAELYDPATGTWSAAGNMLGARFGHAAVLLPSGRVLAMGGHNFLDALTSAELYDPASNTWSPTGSLVHGRYWFSFAWVLPDGSALVAGSFGNNGLASAETYNPSSGTWSLTGSMSEGRGAHRTTLLLDGRVLATGGRNAANGRLDSAEIYSATTGTWSPAGAVNVLFTVALSSPSAAPVSVTFATADDTASDGADYTGGTGTVTFAPGETSRTIAIPVHGDFDAEADETFFVGLSAPLNAVIADSHGLATIANDDFPLSISAPTPLGSDVLVNLPPVSMTFDVVTQAGQTDVMLTTGGPPPPIGFQVGDPPTYIDLSTTAAFAGPIEVCVHYTGLSVSNESLLKLFHFDGSSWIDITTSLNTVANIVCGVTTSLSPFALFEPALPLAPTLSLPAPISVAATSLAGAVVKFTPTATHEIDGPLPVACKPASGATFPVGVTKVTCSARDAAGNTAGGTFNVTVTVGTPRLQPRVLSSTPRSAAGDVMVTLEIKNVGDGAAIETVIERMTLKVLAGSGTPSVLTSVPITLGTLKVGQSRTLVVTVRLPATISRFSLTEAGRFLRANGAAYRFSLSQAVKP